MSGVVAVIAAAVQAVAPSVIALPGDRSTLANALALLVVGIPVWWRYWSAVQRRREADPESEIRSTTRRVYLIVLFGLGGIAVLGAMLSLTFELLTGVLDGNLGTSTLYAIRIQIGLVVAVGAVAAYHRAIRRHDLSEAPAAPESVVRSVILLGSGGREVARMLEERTGVRARMWERPDEQFSLPTESVLEAVEAAEHRQLLIVARPDGIEVIPYSE